MTLSPSPLVARPSTVDRLRSLAAAAAPLLTDPVKRLWRGQTTNGKTGNVPTLTVGETRDESKRSCDGCPLVKGGCYAHGGTVALAHASMAKRYATDPADYTVTAALRSRRHDARIARFSAIGDAARADREGLISDIEAVKAEGLAPLLYTHFHDSDGAWLAPVAAASCGSMEEADRALDAGFVKATVVVSTEWAMRNVGVRKVQTPAGRDAILCPALAADLKGRKGAIDCNRCRLCVADQDHVKGAPVILFIDHGPGTWAVWAILRNLWQAH